MRLLTAHPCSGRRGRQGSQAGSSLLHHPFCFSPRRVGCPIPCVSPSFFLPSACKPQPPCKAIALIPTKFFPFLCQVADLFQPWLGGILGLQVLVPWQIGPKVLLALGDECYQPWAPGGFQLAVLQREVLCPWLRKYKFPVWSPSHQLTVCMAGRRRRKA